MDDKINSQMGFFFDNNMENINERSPFLVFLDMLQQIPSSFSGNVKFFEMIIFRPAQHAMSELLGIYSR